MELKTDDVTLHYEDDGDPAQPPVLMLHGITQSASTWSWLVPHLADDFRVVRLDFRGHGDSGRAPGAYNFPGYVADATAICERVLERPAIVIGHSLGGGTAAALAQTRPDLVRGVVLEDPAITPPPTATNPAGLDDNSLVSGFRVMRDSIPRLQEAGIAAPDLVNMLSRAPSPSGPAFGEITTDDAMLAMAEGMLKLDASVLDAVFDGSIMPVFDPRQELPVPGIVLAGDQSSPDTVLRTPVLQLLAQHSPKLEQRVMTGVGHMIHDSKQFRGEVLTAVQDLLARV